MGFFGSLFERLRTHVTEGATADLRSFEYQYRRELAEPVDEVKTGAPPRRSDAGGNDVHEVHSVDPLELYQDVTRVDDANSDLETRLRLRELFRNEQLFERLLPRSKPYYEEHLAAAPELASYVDHCCESTMFVPMDNRRVIFGSVSSAVLVSTIATPFDAVKNYWICSPKFIGVRFNMTAWEVARALYEKAGFRGFYTGYGAALAVSVPQNLIFFGCYERFRTENPGFMAAMKARVIAVILTTPFEYIRTRMQANPGEATYTQITRRMHMLELPRVYFRGAYVTMFRDVPFSALYWSLNERIKQWIAEKDPEFKSRSNFRSSFVYPFVAGSTAAACGAVLTHPLDVLKTTMQGMDPVIRRRGAIYRVHADAFTSFTLVRKELGIRGFLVGLGPRLAKIIPSCGILLATYDYTRTWFSPPDDDSLDWEKF